MSAVSRVLNFLVLACAVPAVAFAAGRPTVSFDHKADADGIARRIGLSGGDQFEVTVTNTKVPQCQLKVTGIKVEGGPRSEAPAAEETTLSSVQVHDSSYGGYYVSVECLQAVMPSRRWLIIVTDLTWNAAFAGGFTISQLTNPVFEAHAASPGAQATISRNRDKESSARLGLAAFVHLYSERLGTLWCPLTFGLGIKEESRTDYYVGTGVRLGDKGFVTVGANWGPVSRLPDGVVVGDTPTSANTLSNLPTRTSVKAFLGISYTFIDVKSLFTKPFAAEVKK
jgi:hypothetical protein